MNQITTIQGAWSDEEDAWVSESLHLTGDCWLEVELPEKGRLLIRKAETADGPWPMALVSTWHGPSFRIRVYGSTKYPYMKIFTTVEPNSIQYANI